MQEKLFFKNSKGDKLCGVLSNPTGNKERPIIILCHGFTTGKESFTCVRLEKLLNQKNISTFRFDFFGHGESEGKFEDITVSEAVDDILKAIKLVKKKGYLRMGLVGSSFGGLASILAASKTNDLFVLALKAPISDLLGKLISQNNRYPVEKWKDKGFLYHKNDAGKKFKLNYSFFEDAKKTNGYDVAKKIKIPTMIIHGDKDESVPIEQSKKLASLIENCRLEIFKGCDHKFSKQEDFNKMLNLITEFIVENS